MVLTPNIPKWSFLVGFSHGCWVNTPCFRKFLHFYANFRRTGWGKVGSKVPPPPKKNHWKFPRVGSEALGNFSQPPASSRWSFWSSEGRLFFGEKTWTWNWGNKKNGKFIGLPLPSKISSQKITFGIYFTYRALNHTLSACHSAWLFCFLSTKGCSKKSCVLQKNPGSHLLSEMKLTAFLALGGGSWINASLHSSRGLVFLSLAF